MPSMDCKFIYRRFIATVLYERSEALNWSQDSVEASEAFIREFCSSGQNLNEFIDYYEIG